MEGDFRVGAWLVQPHLNSITDGASTRHLEPKVMQLLVELAGQPGEVLPKAKLLRSIWPDTWVSDDVLLRCVVELRKALDDDAREPRFVQTIPKGGYRLIAPVSPATEHSSSRPAAAESTSGPQTLVRTGLWTRPRLVVLAGLLPVLALLFWFLGRKEAPPVTSESATIVIAVLPFQELQNDAEQEYFSEGLTDEVIAELGRLEPRYLRVVARTSTMGLKTAGLQVAEIGRRVSADYVLEGTVRRRSNQVRVEAQLTRVADHSRVWEGSYDRELNRILQVQSELAISVAYQVRITLSEQQRTRFAKRLAVRPEAHEAYLRGRFLGNRRTPESLRRAIDYLEQANRLDPSYAPAHAGLADVLILLDEYADAAPLETAPRAKAAALRALELDPEQADAYASLAMIEYTYEWDWATAERDFRRAVALNPSYLPARHWFANFLASMGRLPEAEEQINVAVRLDTLSTITRTAAAWRVHAAARQYKRAIEQVRVAIELDPDYDIAHRRLGILLMLTGKIDDGIREIRQGVPSESPSQLALADLAHACAAAGLKSEALQLLEQLQRTAPGSYLDASRVALVYTGLGEFDTALDWLDKGYEQRSVGMVVLKPDPRFDPLRTHPRYRALLQRMNLPQ